MEHVEAERLVPLYADDELDAMTAGRFEAHLRDCDTCPPRLDAFRRSRSVLSQALGREPAPEGLRTRILDDIGGFADRDAPGRAPLAPWMRYAATIAATAVLASGATLSVTRSPPMPPLAATAINDHIRALVTHQVTEVASADMQPVKAWFQGRLGFAPAVADPIGADLPLLGGRVDYIDGQTVAALVYGRGQHLVSVFVRPVPDGLSVTPASATRRRFNCVHWGSGGFEYWAVSDVSATELKQVSRRLGNKRIAWSWIRSDKIRTSAPDLWVSMVPKTNILL